MGGEGNVHPSTMDGSGPLHDLAALPPVLIGCDSIALESVRKLRRKEKLFTLPRIELRIFVGLVRITSVY
jgi:hypothetical protein